MSGIFGRPLAPRGHYLTPEEADRFWPKVDERANGEGCWKWKAGCFANGMGAFQVRGKTEAASHIAWAEAGREVHHGKRLLSTCGNAWCVNPDHRSYQESAPKPSRAKREKRERPAKVAPLHIEPAERELPAPVVLPPLKVTLRPEARIVPIGSPSDTERMALLSEPVTTAVTTAKWAIVYTRDHDIVGYGGTLGAACDDALRKRAAKQQYVEAEA